MQWGSEPGQSGSPRHTTHCVPPRQNMPEGQPVESPVHAMQALFIQTGVEEGQLGSTWPFCRQSTHFVPPRQNFPEGHPRLLAGSQTAQMLDPRHTEFGAAQSLSPRHATQLVLLRQYCPGGQPVESPSQRWQAPCTQTPALPQSDGWTQATHWCDALSQYGFEGFVQ